MKFSRLTLPAFLALLTIGSLHAQVADIIIIEKIGQYTQTSAAAPTLGSYRFDVAVSSLADDDLSGITPPNVTLVAGSAIITTAPSAHNGGNLSFNSGEWRYGAPSGYGVNAGSVGALDTLFVNGPTAVTVQGNTYTLDTDGAANDQAFVPPTFPTLTMGGGSWIGGYYVIDVGQILTITTSNWTGFTSAGIGGFIGISLDGAAEERVFSRIAPPIHAGDINETVTSATFTLAANSLTSGTDYDGFATFARFVHQDTSQAGIFAAAWWGNETSFVVRAVPEPSTYAALAGAAALGLAFWHRRRQAQVAA